MRERQKQVLGIVPGQGWTLHSDLTEDAGGPPGGETVVTPVVAWLVVECETYATGGGPRTYRRIIPLTVDDGGATTEGVRKGEWLVPPAAGPA